MTRSNRRPGCKIIFQYLSDILSGRNAGLSDMSGEFFRSFPKELKLNLVPPTGNKVTYIIMHNKNIYLYGVQGNGAMGIFPALYTSVPYKPFSMNFLSRLLMVYYHRHKSAIDNNRSAIISNKHN